jgi:hypothetical protein
MAILGPHGSICRAQHSARDAEPNKFPNRNRLPSLGKKEDGPGIPYQQP